MNAPRCSEELGGDMWRRIFYNSPLTVELNRSSEGACYICLSCICRHSHLKSCCWWTTQRSMCHDPCSLSANQQLRNMFFFGFILGFCFLQGSCSFCSDLSIHPPFILRRSSGNLLNVYLQWCLLISTETCDLDVFFLILMLYRPSVFHPRLKNPQEVWSTQKT